MKLLNLLALTLLTLPTAARAQTTHPISGTSVYKLTQQLLAVAPKRFTGSPGHAAAETFIKSHFTQEAAHGNFLTDDFTARTPIGPVPMHNFLVKYPSSNPGKQAGIIVITSHYETNYPLKDIAFVGANDGACTTALLIALGEYYRTHPPQGYSVWLLFNDGEEAIQSWSDTDSLYGTRHAAAKWSADGTLSHIKAFLVADMIGDKDLNITRITNSTPWLLDTLKQAAKNTGNSNHIFKFSQAEEDDHIPFLQRGVPVLDLLDAQYGPTTTSLPDGYHHTAQDTLDHISPQSLQISADLFLELVKLIDQR
jgi:Zn-dependent M28 family amino/carboxypeptidase